VGVQQMQQCASSLLGKREWRKEECVLVRVQLWPRRWLLRQQVANPSTHDVCRCRLQCWGSSYMG
jgi:hypothetical protein